MIPELGQFALILALAVTRGQQRGLGAVARLMSVLPIVTPPFVIALALVVFPRRDLAAPS